MPKSQQVSADKAAAFLDELQRRVGVKNDRALCARLGLQAPMLSKVRNGHCALTAGTILAIHDATGISVRHIREGFGVSANQNREAA